MTHLHIEADGRTIFDAEVTDYNPPPTLPDNPSPMPVSKLPGYVRDALDKAMLKALEKVGIRVTEYERV